MDKIVRLIRYDWPLHFVLIFTNWLPDNVIFLKFRGFMASFFFKKCGKNLTLGRDVTFYNPSKISLGNNVYIAKGCWFAASEGIEIHNNILFGPYVVMVDSNHSHKNGAYYFGEPIDVKPIIISDGSWIAAHSTILAGSNVNKSVLIAANSVYSGSSVEGGVYGGTPAKLIKKIIDEV